MSKFKTLISIRFKTHNLNEEGECLPPAISDEVKIFSLDGNSEQELKKKAENFIKEVKKCLQ